MPGVDEPLPFNKRLEDLKGRYTQTTGNADLTLAGQQDRIRRSYGLDQGFENADPFSKLKMAQQAYTETQRGAVNSGASRGQLYSGSLDTTLTGAGNAFAKNVADLRQAQQDALTGAQTDNTTAHTNAGDNLSDGGYNALQDALSNPVDPYVATGRQRQAKIKGDLGSGKIKNKNTRKRLLKELGTFS
jgi:hypothetical protein